MGKFWMMRKGGREGHDEFQQQSPECPYIACGVAFPVRKTFPLPLHTRLQPATHIICPETILQMPSQPRNDDARDLQEAAEEEEVRKLQEEVKQMAQIMHEHQTDLPGQLWSILSALLASRRLILPTNLVDEGPMRQTMASPVPDNTEEAWKVQLLKRRISSNAYALPVVSKRINTITARADNLPSPSASSTISAKSRLYEIFVANKWRQPGFYCCQETGPGHLKEFVFMVVMEIAGKEFEVYGEPGFKKKEAAQNAAQMALYFLKHKGCISDYM